MLLYKPIYAVYLDGELIGYCAEKSKLQSKISEYVENGDNDNENLAFVSIDQMPTYKLCLLKRGLTTNDDEIFEAVKQTGIPYYKYYAILDDEEEKIYVSNFETAESIVEKLKNKDSNNIDDISITEKYETELKDFSSEDDAVSALYEKKVVVVASKKSSTSTALKTSGMSSANVSIGISLIKPITGTITSRFASISRVRTGAHTGLDIAASSGTAIKAAASGTVAYAGWKTNGAGNMVIISHGNGVETYYEHCSKIYVSVGDTVSQGDTIAAVGSTGNSTGPHLHLEVRVNGVAYNPQNYVY
jgi:murein DD-endopeptidase MepM/ murein hydrolase activator NlpD